MTVSDSKPRQAKSVAAKPSKRTVFPATASALARYDEDFHRWAFEQATLLRAGGSSGLDVENIAEELEDLGSSQYDKLESALTVLLTHVLKWNLQAARRSRSWATTIRTQRRHFEKVLRKNPSLRDRLDEALSEAYQDARLVASGETNLPLRTFPADCPYDWTTILEQPFDFDPDDV